MKRNIINIIISPSVHPLFVVSVRSSLSFSPPPPIQSNPIVIILKRVRDKDGVEDIVVMIGFLVIGIINLT